MYEVVADFERPPVIEVAASVQFAPLRGASVAHFGGFWREVLGKNHWPTAEEAGRIVEQEERFGSPSRAFSPRMQFRMVSGSEAVGGRIQIRHVLGRMIQIQDTKFVFNWIKKDADYPRYERIRTEFKHHLDEFRKFLDREGLDPIEENQWELTYVNHVPAGDLWNSPTDWPSLLPGLLSSNTKLGPAKLESIRGEWRGEIGKQLGRLHLAIRGQERPLEAGGIEKLLVLHMTARGPMEVGADPCDGLDVGHDAIVSAFLDMTSTEAQEHWGRKK